MWWALSQSLGPTSFWWIGKSIKEKQNYITILFTGPGKKYLPQVHWPKLSPSYVQFLIKGFCPIHHTWSLNTLSLFCPLHTYFFNKFNKETFSTYMHHVRPFPLSSFKLTQVLLIQPYCNFILWKCKKKLEIWREKLDANLFFGWDHARMRCLDWNWDKEYSAPIGTLSTSDPPPPARATAAVL